MSTTNTEVLTLYAIPKIYNGSRYKYFQGLRDDSTSYDTYLSNTSTKTYTATVYYKSLNEPITIKKELKDCDSYTYGKLTVGTDTNNKTYYIFIDRITTDQNGLTTIAYSVDWWSSKWNDIDCTKAHIIRNSNNKPGYMAQPFTPMNTTFNPLYYLGGEGCIVFSYIDSTGDDLVKFGAIDISIGIESVEIGKWNDDLGLPDTDIMDIFIVPLFSIDDFIDYGWDKKETSVVWYSSGNTGSSLIERKVIQLNTPLSTDETKVTGIMDWNGNSIWECPYGVTVDAFEVEINLSLTQCLMRFKYQNEYGNELTGKGFTYLCRHGAIVIDQDKEYTWRLRDYDIEMRKLQSNKQLWTVASDAVQGAGFGYAFGEKTGFQAAGVGGALNVLSTWMMNEFFDPQIQKLTDLKYNRMQDEVSVVGESLTPLYFLSTYQYSVYSVGVVEGIVSGHNWYDFNYWISAMYPSVTFREGDIAYSYNMTPSAIEIYKTTVVYKHRYINGRWYNENKALYQHYAHDRAEYTSAELKEIYEEKVGNVTQDSVILVRYSGTDNTYDRFYYYNGTAFVRLGYHDYFQPSTQATNTYYTYASVEPKLMRAYALEMDLGSEIRMNNDIETNGYYCDEITPNLQNEFNVGTVIQADNITVEGPCTLDGKQQVVYRLQNGVEFI